MKYCKQCGTQNEDDKKFCINCGTLFEAKAAEKKARKPGRWKIVILLMVLFLIFAGMAVVTFYFSNPEQLKREMKNEQWEEAAIIFQKMQNSGDEKKAIEIFLKTAEAYKEMYIDEKVEYSDALKKLDEIKKISTDNQKLIEIVTYIENLHNSRIAFELAEKYWEEQDYENAMIQYKEVLEIDDNFLTAEEKLSEGKEKYKANVIDEVENYVKNEAYDKAIQLIDKAEGILGEDEELEVLSAKYELEELEKTLEMHEELADYKAAIMLLNKSSDLLNSNSGLQKKLSQYQSKYKEQLYTEAKTAYDDFGYEAAVGVLQKGLQLLPKDMEITDILEKYKECEPVSLETLHVLATDDSESLYNKFSPETMEDLYGNEYQGFFEIISYKGDAGFVELLNDNRYTNIKGTFFVDKKVKEDFSIEFRIYADGVKVYNSGYINRKNKAVDFDVDITNAETIKLEAYSTDYSFMDTNPRIYLTNAFVYKQVEE